MGLSDVDGHPSGYFYKHTDNEPYALVKSCSPLYIETVNGQRILDATGGAAVSAIGHRNTRVKEAIGSQLDEVEYCHSSFFKTTAALQLADLLVESTDGALTRACFTASGKLKKLRLHYCGLQADDQLGSEAVETAMKLARQYFLEIDPNTRRHRFIARQGSWHGCTIATLAVGDFKVRKAPYTPILPENVSQVLPCHAYRGLKKNESHEAYIARLAQDLEDEFYRVGPETVCAFIVEPVVGTALGCVPPLPGYLEAMRAVCDRHGALFIYDEIMCGLGRSGTRHAWQAEGTPPDIEIVGKTLGSGYAPISAILINQKVIEALRHGSGCFTHGQTFQNLPVSCAAALEVQCIIQEEDLVTNVARMGALLSSLLHARFDAHPYVGDIRGRGLFWCIEFVADRASKAPFPAVLNIAKRMANRGLEPGYDISLFAATGSADGWLGDHFLLCPPYIVSESDVEEIVTRVVKVVESVFEDVRREGLMKGIVDGFFEGEKGEMLPNGARPHDASTNGNGPDDEPMNGIDGISGPGAIERSQDAPIAV
ncbi:MAG: hypothetical protein Q9183_003453 [Haloplaca sp. 2 TL-2023]